MLGGSVVSVTTDGFITDLEDLESKILSNSKCITNLISSYRGIREYLSGNNAAFELKSKGLGIISWTTRGQFSLDGKISASTGFQSKGIRMEELDTIYRNTMSGEDRVIEFIQSSLRSAKDIYVYGGHVTKKFADRVFRMEFDNKRILNVPVDQASDQQDYSNTLLDSSPAQSVDVVGGLRFLGTVHRRTVYNKNLNSAGSSVYKSYVDLAIRNFVKGCIKDPPGYNLPVIGSYSEIVDFVKSFKANSKISKASISNLKNRKMVVKGVPKTKETVEFIEYVKSKYPSFNDSQFFDGSHFNKLPSKIVNVKLIKGQVREYSDYRRISLVNDRI